LERFGSRSPNTMFRGQLALSFRSQDLPSVQRRHLRAFSGLFPFRGPRLGIANREDINRLETPRRFRPLMERLLFCLLTWSPFLVCPRTVTGLDTCNERGALRPSPRTLFLKPAFSVFRTATCSPFDTRLTIGTSGHGLSFLILELGGSKFFPSFAVRYAPHTFLSRLVCLASHGSFFKRSRSDPVLWLKNDFFPVLVPDPFFFPLA